MILTLPGRLMRHFGAVVGVNMVDVLDGRHGCAMCRAITFEFVGHQPPTRQRFLLMEDVCLSQSPHDGLLIIEERKPLI